MIKVLKPVMCWFLILSVGKKRKQALWWQKIVTFAPPPKLFCLYNHTPLFFCFQLCFTQILAGVSRKSEIADPFYWAADAAFFSFSLATKKETKMAARFYVNNFTIRFFFSHPLSNLSDQFWYWPWQAEGAGTRGSGGGEFMR